MSLNAIIHPTLLATHQVIHDEDDADRMTVDLRNPCYSEGVLKTSEGGVVSNEQMRIQALNIIYTKRTADNECQWKIEAEGMLMVEFCDWIFIADRIEYDFAKKQGTLYNARTGRYPWCFGGETIELCADDSVVIYDGYLTTSENKEYDWQILSPEIIIKDRHLLSARNVQFRFIKLPVFWFPEYDIDLRSPWNPPIKFHARITKRVGSLVGLSYELINYEQFQADLLLDYSFKKGFGGGLETSYEETDGPCVWYSKSYYANDISEYDPRISHRYRLWGYYYNLIDEDKLSIELSYDKLSDKYMATDYARDSIESRTIDPTLLFIRRQEDDWIGSVTTHVRLNNYQTVKEELPSLFVNVRPYDLWGTGIVSETNARIGYIDFLYDNEVPDVKNYSAGRIEFCERLYRPFPLGYATFTPEIGGTALYYTKTPLLKPTFQGIGFLGYRFHVPLFRTYGTCKHIIDPYVNHQYYVTTAKPVFDYYIFDINDGWDNLQQIRFGVNNIFYCRPWCESQVRRVLYCDLYAYAFLNNTTIPSTIPRVFSTIDWFATPRLRYSLTNAWNCEHNQLDYINFRTDWTINNDIAFAAEYRHRSRYSWRKVDPDNYFMDAFLTEAELIASPLSDRRDTVLSHFFWRVNPWLAWEAQSRWGWNRITEPKYHEYQIDCHTVVSGSWQVRLSFQSNENERRFAIFVTLRDGQPNDIDCCWPIPKLLLGNW